MIKYETRLKYLNNIDTLHKSGGELMSQLVECLDEETGEVYIEHYLHDFPNFSMQLLGIATNKHEMMTMITTHNNLNNLFLNNGRL